MGKLKFALFGLLVLFLSACSVEGLYYHPAPLRKSEVSERKSYTFGVNADYFDRDANRDGKNESVAVKLYTGISYGTEKVVVFFSVPKEKAAQYEKAIKDNGGKLGYVTVRVTAAKFLPDGSIAPGGLSKVYVKFEGKEEFEVTYAAGVDPEE